MRFLCRPKPCRFPTRVIVRPSIFWRAASVFFVFIACVLLWCRLSLTLSSRSARRASEGEQRYHVWGGRRGLGDKRGPARDKEGQSPTTVLNAFGRDLVRICGMHSCEQRFFLLVIRWCRDLRTRATAVVFCGLLVACRVLPVTHILSAFGRP